MNALHPIYLRLDVLTTDPKILKLIEERRDELNKLPEIDYEQVYQVKEDIARTIFKAGVSCFEDKDYQTVPLLKYYY